MPHISVLLDEIVNFFRPVTLKVFVDGTLGAGGHSLSILQDHPEMEQFYGFDQDPDALDIAKERLKGWERVMNLIHSNFSHIHNQKISNVDGILLDLGVSSMQLDRPEKGFSFMEDGPLDMRMNPDEELTAAEIVNNWSEEKLGKIFREYGEEKKWRAAARVIVSARKEKAIETTRQLEKLLYPVLMKKTKKGIHPVTLVFQALRIAVNRELEVLEKTLPAMIEMLRPGGRLAVISFHSLEDRIVKNIFRDAASDKVSTSGIGGVFLDKEPLVNLLTRKPVIASDQEIDQNPRSRSAKLRVVERR